MRDEPNCHGTIQDNNIKAASDVKLPGTTHMA